MNNGIKNDGSWKLIANVLLWTVVVAATINALMCVTDLIYKSFGMTLSPVGVGNKEWLGFWGNLILGDTALASAFIVWKDGRDNREFQCKLNEEKECREDIEKEEQVIVNVCKAIDIGMSYKVITLMENNNFEYLRMLVQNARDELFTTQSELEILTGISVPIEDADIQAKPELAIIKNVRDIYYTIENNYGEILNACDEYIGKKEALFRNNKIVEETKN